MSMNVFIYVIFGANFRKSFKQKFKSEERRSKSFDQIDEKKPYSTSKYVCIRHQWQWKCTDVGWATCCFLPVTRQGPMLTRQHVASYQWPGRDGCWLGNMFLLTSYQAGTDVDWATCCFLPVTRQGRMLTWQHVSSYQLPGRDRCWLGNMLLLTSDQTGTDVDWATCCFLPVTRQGPMLTGQHVASYQRPGRDWCWRQHVASYQWPGRDRCWLGNMLLLNSDQAGTDDWATCCFLPVTRQGRMLTGQHVASYRWPGRDKVRTHKTNIWAPSNEFVSSSIPPLQILTAHAQPFRGARDPSFCLKVPLDSLLEPSLLA